MSKKVFPILLVLAMLLGSVSALAGDAITYPLEGVPEGTVIQYWKPISGDLARKMSNDNDSMFAKYLQEKTGLAINFINPAQGAENEQFNLLLASNDQPDIIEKAWLNDYPAGMDDAIRKKLVMDLNDVLDSWAPALAEILNESPALDKKLKTDAGAHYGFPFIRESSYLCCWRGPVVRKDLLDKAGLPVPETIDEWTTMLRAFKDMGLTAPLSVDGIGNLINEGAFCAWGAMPGMYVEDGKVVYGPIQPGFKDMLMLLRGWYAEGLFDKNFSANKGPDLTALIGNGQTGATIGNTGGGIGAWTPVVQKTDPNAILAAAKYPTVNKGETAKFGQMEQDFYQNYIVATVNPKSKNAEWAVKLLNYGYTEEGYLFYNYGVEGESYDMIDGVPTMKEEIAKAADNKAEWSNWARSPYNGPMVQAENYLKQLLVLQEQKDAIPLWFQNDRALTILPPVSQSTDEASEYKAIWSDVDTYYQEFIVKFICGDVAEDAYENEFVPTVQSMNIDRAIELRQAALDRYNAR